jgi:hypothetical protein
VLRVQASLRPVLANLAFHYKLDLTVLRALQHLLALLSSWFNVTLGALRLLYMISAAASMQGKAAVQSTTALPTF